jgi:autotransporter-associated beta strand protein
MEWIGRPGGWDHTLINNSANTASITSNLFFQAGGAAQFTLDFSGSGNWVVSNYLGNNNGPNMGILQEGPGTLTWYPTGYVDADGIAFIGITGGTLVLAGPHPKINTQAITNDGVFQFNAPGQSQTLSGVISGYGEFDVNNGTLTLAGQNTFYGFLVLNGGTVIADAAENGSAGPLGENNLIEFNGGTLEFTSLDFADYSGVFDSAAGQLYNFNLNGQNPVFASGLYSSGGSLTLTGPGSLTLAGNNTYSGGSTVNSGKLILSGTTSGTGNMTVENSAAFGIFESDQLFNSTPFTPATLVVGTTSGATLEFNNVTNSEAAPIQAGAITTGGPITININSGTFTNIGQTFPLISWTSGKAPAVQLGLVTGAGGFLSTNGQTIQMNVTALAYDWTGLNNGNWDTNTTGNWIANGKSAVFANGGPAVFNDNATGTTTVKINSVVSPSSVSFSDNLLAYSLASTSAHYLAGSGGLVKQGTNTVSVSGGFDANTGVTTILQGTLSVSNLANGSLPSDLGAATNSASSLLLNGGALQYTGSAVSIDRLFTVGTAGGTIDSEGGALQFTNTGLIGLSGSGARVLTLMGAVSTNTNVLASVLSDSGLGTQLAVSGTSTWALTANNTNTGLTTINPGARLQVGMGGATGSLVSSVKDNGSLVFNNSGTVTNAAISGTGNVTVAAGMVVLSSNNTYSGGTTVNTNCTLQIGTGGSAGALFDAAYLVDNGLVIIDTTGGVNLVNASVTGTGGMIFHKGFSEMSAYNDNNYTGWVQIDPGATYQPVYGNEPVQAFSGITNNGTLYLTRQDGITVPPVYLISVNMVGTGKLVKENNNQNPGQIGLDGTNTYTGDTFIAGGGIIIGDGTNAGAGSITGTVWFTNTTTSFDNPRMLTFYRPDNFTFTNNIINVATVSAGGNFGTIEQSGTGTVTLTGNNNYLSGTIIDASTTLQVGAGGTSGNLGGGAVTDNGTLVFDRSDTVVFTNAIGSGTGVVGSVVQIGPGTLELFGANTYIGATTVSNGALVVTNVAGDLDVYGGILIPGGDPTVNALTVASNLNMNAGTIVVYVNKALSPASSNTTISVGGSVNITGGTIKLVNLGPSIAVGDVFKLFGSSTIANLSGVTVVAPGFTLSTANLATSGTVTVASVAAPGSEIITATVSAGQLNLSWPAIWTGAELQVQTNPLTIGISSNWVTIPGVDSGNTYSAPLNTTGAVFYRLAP